MSVWDQIVAAHINPPTKKAKFRPLVTEKRCALCQQIKPRAQFYEKTSGSPNSLSSKCKPCHIAHNNARAKARRR